MRSSICGYATTDNFTKVRLYPTNARCLISRNMAPGLATAGEVARQGLRLVFWDCYRPHSAQVKCGRWCRTRPGSLPGNQATSHEAGRSVDVAFAQRDGRRLDMGTGFDDLTPGLARKCHRYQQRRAGKSCDSAFGDGSRRTVVQYEGEWWHYDGPGSGTPRPHLNAPVCFRAGPLGDRVQPHPQRTDEAEWIAVSAARPGAGPRTPVQAGSHRTPSCSPVTVPITSPRRTTSPP